MNTAEQSPTYVKVVGNIDRAVASLIETGFVELLHPDRPADVSWRQYWKIIAKEWPVGTTFMRKVLKKIARELKRPYVIVEGGRDGQREITIKKRRFIAPLVAPLMLLPEKDGRRGEIWHEGRGIRFRQDTSNYYIKFDTHEAYVEWRGFVLDAPECRKALKLPEANNVIPLAA